MRFSDAYIAALGCICDVPLMPGQADGDEEGAAVVDVTFTEVASQLGSGSAPMPDTVLVPYPDHSQIRQRYAKEQAREGYPRS